MAFIVAVRSLAALQYRSDAALRLVGCSIKPVHVGATREQWAPEASTMEPLLVVMSSAVPRSGAASPRIAFAIYHSRGVSWVS